MPPWHQINNKEVGCLEEGLQPYFSSMTVWPLLFISSTMIFSSSGSRTWGMHSFRTAAQGHRDKRRGAQRHAHTGKSLQRVPSTINSYSRKNCTVVKFWGMSKRLTHLSRLYLSLIYTHTHTHTHTCGGLVEAGPGAVGLNHLQDLSVLLKSCCACQSSTVNACQFSIILNTLYIQTFYTRKSGSTDQ